MRRYCPFRLEGDRIAYLHGPGKIEVFSSTEGGGAASLTFTVNAVRQVNIDTAVKMRLGLKAEATSSLVLWPFRTKLAIFIPRWSPNGR